MIAASARANGQLRRSAKMFFYISAAALGSIPRPSFAPGSYGHRSRTPIVGTTLAMNLRKTT